MTERTTDQTTGWLFVWLIYWRIDQSIKSNLFEQIINLRRAKWELSLKICILQAKTNQRWRRRKCAEEKEVCDLLSPQLFKSWTPFLFVQLLRLFSTFLDHCVEVSIGFSNSFWLSSHRSRKPKGEPKEKKSGEERLGAKQRRKIKSKAFVSSSEDSDSDTEKLKIADV